MINSKKLSLFRDEKPASVGLSDISISGLNDALFDAFQKSLSQGPIVTGPSTHQMASWYFTNSYYCGWTGETYRCQWCTDDNPADPDGIHPPRSK